MEIREDDLTGTQVIALLREHLDNMHDITPPGSVHALPLEELRAPNITFWSAWNGERLLGCGALKELSADEGEIKSMRTSVQARRTGVARRMLEFIIDRARERNYRVLYLETGAYPEFIPARTLYSSHGFTYRGPFAGYTADPNSVFMQKEII